MSTPIDVHPIATKKEKFDLSIGMLKGYYDGLESRVERVAVFMLGVAGWLITSETARKSLATDRVLFLGAVISLTVFIVMCWANIAHFLKRFKEIQSEIEKLEYADPKYFTRYRMPERINGIAILYIYLMPVLVIYVLTLLLLFHIRFSLFKA